MFRLLSNAYFFLDDVRLPKKIDTCSGEIPRRGMPVFSLDIYLKYFLFCLLYFLGKIGRAPTLVANMEKREILPVSEGPVSKNSDTSSSVYFSLLATFLPPSLSL